MSNRTRPKRPPQATVAARPAAESHVDSVAAAPGGGAESTGGRGDLILRILGGLVGVAGGLVTAVLEVFLSPLRAGTVRLPVSVLLAVLTNVLLVWFTYRTTGRRGAALLPWLVWIAVMLMAAKRTTEGDLLLTGDNWVGLVTILAGTAAFGVAAYRMIVPRPGTPT